MKKIITIFFALFLFCVKSNASNSISAYLTYATFHVSSKNSSYVETYVTVIGNSLKFVKNKNGKFQGAINIGVQFIVNNEIKNASKYTLNSPEIDDTLKAFPNFLDVQRYVLSNANYQLKITISDKNDVSQKPFETTTQVNINYMADKMQFSDIELLEKYSKSETLTLLTKSGYDLIPYVANYFPENISSVKFYAELYNAKKILGDNEKMLINYYIESFENKVKLDAYSNFMKQNCNEVNIILAELNISELPSGNYNLVVESRDKSNKIQAENKYFFQRKNKKNDLSYEDIKAINVSNTFVKNYENYDTLKDYIRCLQPISGTSEMQFAENQLAGRNIELMQQYFYNFWKARYPLDPELAWLEYYKEIIKVNREFGSTKTKGYDTPRGRVYLQYGAPSSRNKFDNDPTAYPYEIWQYDVLFNKTQLLNLGYKKEVNKHFVFMSRDYLSKYDLIHSDAKGELYDARWQLLLNNRTDTTPNIDVEKTTDHYGGNVDDDYRHPK